MTRYLAAASVDFDALTALNPGTAIAVIRQTGPDGFQAVLDGTPLGVDDLTLGLVAVVILSEAARPDVGAFMASLKARTGDAGPSVLDLTGNVDARADQPARQIALHRALVAHLLSEQQMQSQRMVGLMRDLSQMRRTYDQMQTSFARLEGHLYRHGLADRQQAIVLPPPEGAEPVNLAQGLRLEQRLPGDSQGLCDIAVLVLGLDQNAAGGDGTLSIQLSTKEDSETHAVWLLPAIQLQPGWLRLSLPKALAADARTAMLHLEWDGAGHVALAQAMRHPDPRFQLQHVSGDSPIKGNPQGRCLALQLWTFVPGCMAPAPSDGIFPSGRIGDRPVRRFLVSGDVLATAVNLRPDNQPYLYLHDHQSLLLHVSAAGPSVGLLAGLCPAQTSRVSARIMTRAENGPPVEYALALAPTTGAVQPGTELPAFDPGFQSDWYRLPPMTEGEVHLILPGPLGGAHDLYMLARLPEGIVDASWGWSTFSTLRMVL